MHAIDEGKRPLQSILYVDDEPDIREIVQMALTLEGDLTVHTAESGMDALRLIPKLKPDLVLLDAMMPQLDGTGTLKQIRASKPTASTPVIFVTAKAMPQEVERFVGMGAAGVIAKPFDPMKLREQVLAMWESLQDV